jgi:hypothetical protein
VVHTEWGCPTRALEHIVAARYRDPDAAAWTLTHGGQVLSDE